jgi:diguanylate cyclase (GGDEF)-like protein
MSDLTPQSDQRRVLLAGESGRAAAKLEAVLTAAGLLVRVAPSGEDAITLAAEITPDLILCDAALPDMSGTDLCRSLLIGQRVGLATPILIVTPEPPTTAEQLAAIRAGARDCVGPWLDGDTLPDRCRAYADAHAEIAGGMTDDLVDQSTGLYNRRGFVRRAREISAQAGRHHQALACVVFELDLDPETLTQAVDAYALRCAQGIQASGRLSDIVGRLGATEFAILAPATDAAGAVKMVERLAQEIRVVAARAGVPYTAVRIQAGYEALGNVRYSPMDPVALLLRASTALRSGRPEPSAMWIRRFVPHAPGPPRAR